LPVPSFNEKFGGFTVEFHKPYQDTPQDTPQDGIQDGKQDGKQESIQDLGTIEISEFQ